MTRVLSELLGARGPAFQLHMQQLEKLSGKQNADIRLTSQVQQSMRSKLAELYLDPHDTTGPELYASLGARLIDDQKQLLQAMQTDDTVHDEPLTRIVHTLGQYIVPNKSFSMKAAVARRILKSHLPKRTMKALGYRSLDSMLKHESVASLFAAAWIAETPQWTKKVVQSYTKLHAIDFEMKPLLIDAPSSKRWQAFSGSMLASKRHQVLSFTELGAIVVLPVPPHASPIVYLSTTVASLHALNDIRSGTTYLKMNQVKSHFGTIVQNVVIGETSLPAHIIDQNISWHLIQQYFARLGTKMRADLFEPVIQVEDLAWHSVEDIIAHIQPSLGFWRGTSHLAALHEGSPVSCNLLDAITNFEHGLSYENRSSRYFIQSLKSELTLLYLNHDKIVQTIHGNLQNQFQPLATK